MSASELLTEAIVGSGLTKAHVSTEIMGWNNRQDLQQKIKHDSFRASELFEILDRMGWSVIAVNRENGDILKAREIDGISVSVSK